MNQDLCKIHGFNISHRNNDDFTQCFCKICVKENFNIIPENEVQEKLKTLVNNLINCQQGFMDQNTQEFNTIFNNLAQLNYDVKQLQINMIKESQKLLDIFKGYHNADITPLYQALDNFRMQFQFIREKELILKSFSQIQQAIKSIDQQNTNHHKVLDQLLQEVQKDRKGKQQQESQSQQQNKRIIIQPLYDYSVQFQNYCKSMAINSNGEILAVGCEKIIYIYEVRAGMLIEQDKKNAHQDKVLCLLFMKQNDILISGGGKKGSQIYIWQISKNFKMQQMFLLTGHTDSIFCLELNENEDLIISGSKDQTIKFWNKKQEWKNQQTIHFESPIQSLSLNQSENQLISAVRNKEVYVLKKSTNQQWEISYIIDTMESVLRLLFISDNEFVIQQKQQQFMELYQFNEQIQVFIKAQTIDLKEKENNNNFEWLFPMKFLKSYSLLVNKNGRYVHFISRSKNGQFTILKTVEYLSQYLYGTVSNDGQYLFTWDYHSSSLQVKKIIIQ